MILPSEGTIKNATVNGEPMELYVTCATCSNAGVISTGIKICPDCKVGVWGPAQDSEMPEFKIGFGTASKDDE